MPYIVKNVSGRVIAIPLEGTLSISLLPNKQADLTQWCTNEWILRNETLSGLVTKNYLAIVHDTISGTSPYFDSISEDTSGNVSMRQSLAVGDDLTVTDDAFIGDDLTVDGDIIDSGGGIEAEVVKKTTEDITLYVRTTGSDSNEGSTEATALLTIQAAIDKIPTFINHTVVIDVGEGTFAGFEVRGRTCSAAFTIQGTLGTPTLTGGTASGTATGGDNWTLIDSGQNWTPSELKGMLLYVNSTYVYIHDNTDTQIDLGGRVTSTCSGKAYTIQENKTIINAPGAGATFPYAQILDTTCLATSSTIGVIIDSFKIDATTNSYGIAVMNTGSASFKKILIEGHIVNTAYAMFTQSTFGDIQIDELRISSCAAGLFSMRSNIRVMYRLSIDNIGGNGIYLHSLDIGGVTSAYVSNCGDAGIIGASAPGHMNFDYVKISDCNVGLVLAGVIWADMDGSEIWDCTTYGVALGTFEGWRSNVGLADLQGTHNIHDNGSGGILVTNGSRLRLTSTGGSGNSGYGVIVESGGAVTITSTTSITGTSGDATIDNGMTPLTWATDFANDGDTVTNDYNYCRIERTT